MKKNLLFLSAVIVFASCQKSEHYFNNRGSCTQHDPEEQQTNNAPTLAAKESWGKNWNYVDPANVTQTAPYNCYDNAKGDPIVVRPISTADGPRYASAVAVFFNGNDWENAFPGLADATYAADLSKLQSGDYYFEIKTNGSITYFVGKDVADQENIDFVLAFEAETE